MEEFAGQAVGQKPGDQWRGTDAAPPGKKLVGDSILKDLSKGATPKTKEQELAEEWATFSEENIGTHPKRPARKNARHSRGHEPQARYKTVKADEAANPAQQAAIAIAMKKDGKKPKQVDESDEGISEDSLMDMIYDILSERPRLGDNAVIKLCKQYVEEDGDTFTNDDIVRIKQLLPSARQDIRQSNLGEAYKTANPHPASKDPIVATVVKQMRPGLTGLEMGNEAFLYFAYELGKQRARDSWSDYLPAIRHAYEQGLNEDANTDNKLAKLLTRFINQNEGAGSAVAADAIEYIKKIGHIEQFATSLDYFAVDLDEGLEEDGSVEARWMVKVSDDEGDHLKTYHRKFPSLSDAKKAYKNTPYATDFKYKPVKKDQVEEAVDSDIVQAMGQDSFNRAGYNPLRDERDYLDTLSKLKNLELKPGLDQAMKDHITQRILDLNAEARKKGFTQVESRGHKIIATKLKDIERAKKFASGELKVPTPQERQAQLKQLEKSKPVKEFVAPPPQGTANQTMQQKTQAQDPKQAQAVAQATQAMKSATQSSAPAPLIAKALDAASQGKPVAGQEASALQPLMKDMATIAQDPKLAGSFKSLISQINQTQIKQQQK